MTEYSFRQNPVPQGTLISFVVGAAIFILIIGKDFFFSSGRYLTDGDQFKATFEPLVFAVMAVGFLILMFLKKYLSRFTTQGIVTRKKISLNRGKGITYHYKIFLDHGGIGYRINRDMFAHIDEGDQVEMQVIPYFHLVEELKLLKQKPLGDLYQVELKLLEETERTAKFYRRIQILLAIVVGVVSLALLFGR